MRSPAALTISGADSPKRLLALVVQDNRIRLITGLICTIAVVMAIAWAADVSRLREAMAALAHQPALVLLFLLPYTTAFALRAMAWRSLLPGLRALPAFAILQASLFANHVLPIKAGEVVRPYLAARRGVALADAAATTILARLLDFASLMAIAGVLFAFASGSPLLGWRASLLPILTLVGSAGLIGWLRSSHQPEWMPGPVREALRPAREALQHVTLRQVASAGLWTLPSWILEGSVLYVAAHVMGIDLSFQAAVAATAFTILFQAFHFTPGGLGVYEVMMTAALSAYGIPAQDALALALLAHGLKFAYSYTIGLGFTGLATRSRPFTFSGSLSQSGTLNAVRDLAGDQRLLAPLSALGTAMVLTFVGGPGSWLRFAIGAVILLPLILVFHRFRFSGRLRLLLWALLLAAVAVNGQADVGAVAVLAGVYAVFAGIALAGRRAALGEVVWEHLPKVLILFVPFQALTDGPWWTGAVTAGAFALASSASVVLARQWVLGWSSLPSTPMSTELARRPLAVVIPAYNEALNLPRTLAAIPRGTLGNVRVIVVDDGSTDCTSEVARASGADIVLGHERNRGLGAALRTGLIAAKELDCRSAVYIDADGEYDPREIPGVAALVERGAADYVLGSRYLGSRQGQRWSRNLANRVFTVGLSVVAGRHISDGQTGFRAFSRRAIDAAEIIHDYNYAQVLTLDLLNKRMRMAEVPISWRRREAGVSFVRMEYLWRVPLGIFRQLLRA